MSDPQLESSFKTVRQIKQEQRVRILGDEIHYPVAKFWDDFDIRIAKDDIPLADDDVINLITESFRVEVIPIFHDGNKEKLIETLVAVSEVLMQLANKELEEELASLSEDHLRQMLSSDTSSRYDAIFAAAFSQLTGESYDQPYAPLLDQYLDISEKVATEGIEHHVVGYAGGPSIRELVKEKVYIPVIVALAGTLGALAALAEPLGAVVVGGASGVVSLLVNLLSARLTGEYGLKKDYVLRLLGERYSPVRMALIWQLLRAGEPLTVSQLTLGLPYSEPAVRYWLARLEEEGYVARGENDASPTKWQIKR